MKNFIIKLKKLRACSNAVEYASSFSSLKKAWNSCERGDWMLWLIGKTCDGPGTKSRKKLVHVACKCARTAWKWMLKDSKNAIKVAEKYCNGKADIDEVRAAADAADAADAACAAYAAAYVADAAYAARAARAAARAARAEIDFCALADRAVKMQETN